MPVSTKLSLEQVAGLPASLAVRSANIISITQPAHGFVAGEVLTLNSNGIYVRALATTSATAEVIGVVTSVQNANLFELGVSGTVINLASAVPGSVQFLSATTAGALSLTDVSEGNISKPVAIGLAAGVACVLISRGFKKAVTPAQSRIYNESPSGLRNGSNKVFTLQYAPVLSSLRLYRNGLRVKRDSDYTVTNFTISFIHAPIVNADLIADYDIL